MTADLISPPVSPASLGVCAEDALACRYVQFPLIFIAFLRAEGWRVAAYSHKTDPDAWCVKVRSNAIVTVSQDGHLSWGRVPAEDRSALVEVRDRALAAYAGLMLTRVGPRLR